ncbi:MAG: pilus assembly protein [Chloroflexi bacterium]|nr:pilus assembly protein [Chloroflexota bacterium]
MKKRSPSQALLEFALALPILLLVIFAIIDFALLFQAWLTVENVARQTIRYAVTGQYDPINCPVGGCLNDNDEDTARLGTVKSVAQGWTIGLFIDQPATIAEDKTQIGYFHVTVCSNADRDNNGVADYVVILPRMGNPGQYADCLITNTTTHQEDAGQPGGRVIVMVDFNHPYITPFFHTLWPWTHLSSYREGIVERFRVARSIDVPPALNLPTDTPTETPLPSDTPTPTLTFTPTSTFTPTFTPTKTFTPTMTFTPTNTRTPTATPTPDCSLFVFSAGFSQTTSSGLPRARIPIYNGSTQATYIQSIDFDWDAYDASNPSQSLNRWRFDGNSIVTTDDPDSHTTWTLGGTPGSTILLNPGETDYFDFDYLNADASWPAIVPANSFGLIVTLTNGCMVEIDAEATPTPTKTSTITLTPTITNTPTITRTPTITNTPTRTNTPTVTNTPTRTPSPTITRTPTITFTPTLTFTITNTPTITFTPTKTLTPTVTFTPTITNTVTRTFTPTITFTPTKTFTPTITFTPTKTRTPTPTASQTLTRTPTPSPTPSPTRTSTSSPTPIITPTKTPTKSPTPPCTDGC